MREALHRCWVLLFCWVPDLRDAPVRRQATVAIVASTLLHALLFFIAVLVIALRRETVDFALTKPKPQELVIEMQPRPAPPPEPPRIFTLSQLQEMQYLDSTGLAKSEIALESAPFESDQNMVAASESAPTGNLPLPSMDGRTDLPFTNFKTQDALVGGKTEAFPNDVAMTSSPVPPPPAPNAAPPVPKVDPRPTAADPLDPPEPPKLKAVTEPKPGEIAFLPGKVTPPITRLIPPLAKPQPIPVELPKPPVEPLPPIMPPAKPEPVTDLARLTTPAPKPAPKTKPSYQSQQERTRIEGNISNRGKAAVDAVRTPLAVYKKQISEAIGSRWLYYVKQRMDVVTIGIVQVSFFVTKEGRVQDVQVLNNTSNESFAQLCQQSVLEAEFAPAPPETFDAMKDGRLEITFTFNLYPN